MITPEEIKRGLECCHELACTKCPYWLTKGCAEVLQEDAKVCIQQLEQRVPRWISVKERLPEKQRRVIVCNGHGVVTVGWRSYHRDKTGNELWVIGDEPHKANDIVLWMPLPEPPEEGEG